MDLDITDMNIREYVVGSLVERLELIEDGQQHIVPCVCCRLEMGIINPCASLLICAQCASGESLYGLPLSDMNLEFVSFALGIEKCERET